MIGHSLGRVDEVMRHDGVAGRCWGGAHDIGPYDTNTLSL